MSTATISLQVNAFDPERELGRAELTISSRELKLFALASGGRVPPGLLAPPPAASFGDFRHPDVGWGLVVSGETTKLPESLAQLVAERKAPVFHYLPGWEQRLSFLRNVKEGRDVAIAGSPIGNGPGRLPFYLLLHGTPAELPWGLQFDLAATRAVGRLPLHGHELDNYVQALLHDFSAAPADPYRTLTWAVDHGPDDITSLMRTWIADKLQQRMLQDPELGPERALFLDGRSEAAAATIARLTAALAEHRPGLVVTTSHGLTGPLRDPERMRRGLGLPVDQQHAVLDVDALLARWSPSGAVWYCHACCSAGSEAPSAFAPLFSPELPLRATLDAIASLGASVAPLPLRLLGHRTPLRAFVGHVEPTFDWTLRNPKNRQVQTAPIVDALYPKLYEVSPRNPIGQAFRPVHTNIGGYLSNWEIARARYTGADSLPDLLWLRLCARDLQSLVILGDPAAALALRPGAAAR